MQRLLTTVACNSTCTQPRTPKTCCKLSTLPACCNLSTSCNELVNFIKLQQVCKKQACCNLSFADLLQLVETVDMRTILQVTYSYIMLTLISINKRNSPVDIHWTSDTFLSNFWLFFHVTVTKSNNQSYKNDGFDWPFDLVIVT